jgi:hypothetical protein
MQRIAFISSSEVRSNVHGWHSHCSICGAKEVFMPEKQTIKRARRAKREGKAPSTQAGEFVREEIHHIREGKHGARSTKQAIAIGLSKARRAGVKLTPPRKGKVSESTRRNANGTTRRVTKRSHRHLAAAPKPVNGRSNARLISLHRLKRCKNRRAQTLPDARHSPRAAVDVRWALAKPPAPARDESKGEV